MLVIKTILLVFAIAMIICGFVAMNIKPEEWDDDAKKFKSFAKTFIKSGISLFIVFVLLCSFVIIPTGYTGVRTTFGQIDSVTMQNGFNWKIPFVQSVQRVNNKQQDMECKDKVWSETQERTAIFYENITVTYQINPEKSAWIYANVSDYKSNLISDSIVASAVKSSSKSLSDSDATNRSIIEPLCAKNLQASLDGKYGENVVHVNKVIINNADFEDSYNAAIAAKQKAQLEAERQEIENKRAVEKAEADATVTRTNAAAQADAKLMQAEADAQANELLEESLTEHILRQNWITKWNGELPMYTGDGASFLFDGIQ